MTDRKELEAALRCNNCYGLGRKEGGCCPNCGGTGKRFVPYSQWAAEWQRADHHMRERSAAEDRASKAEGALAAKNKVLMTARVRLANTIVHLERAKGEKCSHYLAICRDDLSELDAALTAEKE